MKWIYPLVLVAGMAVFGTVLLVTESGCDEIKAPCDMEETQKGSLSFGRLNLESWKVENGVATLRFIYPKETGNTITATSKGSVNTSIYWFELPMVFTFNFGRPKRLQIGFGPYAAYGLQGKVKNDFSIQYFLEGEPIADETNIDEKDLLLVNLLADTEANDEVKQVNRLDYGLYLMLAYKIPHWALTLPASIGYSNLVPYSGEDLLFAQSDTKTERNFAPVFTLTYFLNKGMLRSTFLRISV